MLIAVTVASGVISAFLVSSPVTSISLSLVSTMYLARQLMTFQVMRRSRIAHKIQITAWTRPLPTATVVVRIMTHSRPPNVTSAEPITAAGCVRTIVDSSCGPRNLAATDDARESACRLTS
jgi:hypothetical protein